MPRTQYDFTKQVNISKLEKEIMESGISLQLIDLILYGTDTLSIAFEDALSTGDSTILNDLITAHDIAPVPTIDGVTFTSTSFGNADGTPLQSKTTSIKRLRTFIYQGNDFWLKEPVEVKVSCYMSLDGYTGTIRLYDKTNDVVLGSVDFTNIIEETKEIVCTGWSTSEALIELQAKTTDKKALVNITGISILG